MARIKYKDATRMEQWIIAEAIADNRHNVAIQNKAEDGTIEVKLYVGDIEVDFQRACKLLEDQLECLVSARARKILYERYGNLIAELEDMQERISSQKDKFRYEWEEETK